MQEALRTKAGIVNLQKHAIVLWKKESDRYEQLLKKEVKVNARLHLGLDNVTESLKKIQDQLKKRDKRKRIVELL